jgi:hypothetical protein
MGSRAILPGLTLVTQGLRTVRPHEMLGSGSHPSSQEVPWQT